MPNVQSDIVIRLLAKRQKLFKTGNTVFIFTNVEGNGGMFAVSFFLYNATLTFGQHPQMRRKIYSQGNDMNTFRVYKPTPYSCQSPGVKIDKYSPCALKNRTMPPAKL